jgi:inorganic triphosphatase YgiF
MPSATPNTPVAREVELKLALADGDPGSLARQLAQTAVLKRRRANTFALHNIYFDTPDQRLRQQHAALRLRRVGDGATAHWLQTLKTSQPEDSALSSRGEWEGPVAGPRLEHGALDPGAWSQIDPKDRLFPALQAVFVTDFQRTVWLVRRRDRSTVEVALDIGRVHGADRSASICELELELKAGPVSALFEVATEIAGSVALLPLAMSKAQRGYALASDSIDAAVLARPPALRRGMSLPDTSRAVLREMFAHFTGNLVALRHSDMPEVVHQARVAWRRFRSARRLFKPVLGDAGLPAWQELDPLLAVLGEIRDLDVARDETLPLLREAYVDRSAARARTWDALLAQLSQHAMERRNVARRFLEDPAVGNCLLQTTRWLDAPAADADAQPTAKAGGLSLRQWAIQRATRLHGRLKRATQNATDAPTRHGARILAKRTRYSIEALHDVLPRHITHKWYRQAVQMQKSIGSERDLQQAITLLSRLTAPSDIVAFLRGVAAGREAPSPGGTPG